MLNMRIDRNFFLSLDKPLILDGPMGTLLIERGVDTSSVLWSAKVLLSNPEIVKSIHIEYIKAGADIITTNTFRTNPFTLKQVNLKLTSFELVNKAVNIARKATSITDKKILIAGSNAPADDCYLTYRCLSQSELEKNHREHIENLIESKVDFILNETFGDKEEAILVSKICNEYLFPFAISLLIDFELKTFFGQDLRQTLEELIAFQPVFVSLNCSRPEIILKALNILSEYQPFCVYPNLGSVESFNTGNLVRDFSKDQLKEFLHVVINKGVKVIGVCCGGNPDDIKLIRQIVDEL